MMHTAYAQNAYRSMELSDSSPLELIIKLYNGTINFLSKAVNAIDEGDRPQKVYYINKSRAIIEELLSSLDPNVGGDVVANLQDLYSYMLIELTKANATDDKERLAHIQELLRTLKLAWNEAGTNMTLPAASPSPSPGIAPVTSSFALST